MNHLGNNSAATKTPVQKLLKPRAKTINNKGSQEDHACIQQIYDMKQSKIFQSVS